MDPILEEFCRINMIGNFQVHSFRRMQRYFMSELGPKIDRLEAENAALKAENAELKAQLDAQTADIQDQPTAEPLKRKRGRPRKYPVVEEPIPV